MRLSLMGLASCGALLVAACSGGGGNPTGPSGATAPRLSRIRFMAFGDSLTLGEVTTPMTGIIPDGPIARLPLSGPLVVVPSAAYPTLLQSQLATRYIAQAGSISVTNAGKAGEHAHEGAARFAAAFSAAQPEVVLLWEGVNSLTLYGTDLPMLALTEMLAEAKGRGARVFIANMPPPRPGLRNSQSVLRLQEMNDRIKALAAAEGALLVNIYDTLLPEVDTVIGNDGLHPTEAGYRRIAEVFFAAIRAELEVK